jgi:branched-chain amino acid transport system permease protein
MDQILQTIIIGLANGLIFALVALGYTLVYGIIELINFAHGEVFMLGSFIALVLISTVFAITADTPLLQMVGAVLIILVITMLATAAINVSIERVAYRPLRNAPKLAPLISAIGMSFILQNIALLIFGPANDSVE